MIWGYPYFWKHQYHQSILTNCKTWANPTRCGFGSMYKILQVDDKTLHDLGTPSRWIVHERSFLMFSHHKCIVLYIYHILHYIFIHLFHLPKNDYIYKSYTYTYITYITFTYTLYLPKIHWFLFNHDFFLTIWGLGSPITTNPTHCSRDAPFVLAESPVGWLVSLVVKRMRSRQIMIPFSFFRLAKIAFQKKLHHTSNSQAIHLTFGDLGDTLDHINFACHQFLQELVSWLGCRVANRRGKQ